MYLNPYVSISVCIYVVGCAAGKGANNAKTELEKLLTKHAVEGISCNQAVFELAKMYVLIDICDVI